MRMAIGPVKPDSGGIKVDGIDPVRDPISARMAVSYAPEEILIYEGLTSAEWLSFLGYKLHQQSLAEGVDRLQYQSSCTRP